jgi:choline dehydrogenase-like flavoprotein
VLDDARTVPSGATVEADICIIGAGAAGITIAHELIGKPPSVCLLESGGLSVDAENQSLYTGRNVGLPYFALHECQLRFLGGNTNAWGGWCRPLDVLDFEEREWVEHSGWPFPRTELMPFYRRAHTLCELASDRYDPETVVSALGDARARILPFDPSKLESSIYRFSSPTRFGRVYRERLRAATNVHCFLNANVLGIKANGNARVATSVAVGCLSGNRFTVTAKYFVLAAGGIENARLLLLSNDVVAKGLGNEHDLVGRFFMEHPHTKRHLIATGPAMSSALYGLAFHRRGVSARISLPAELQRRERLLNYSGNIHTVYAGQDSAAWLALRKLVLSIDPARRADPYIRFPPFGRKGLSVREAAQLAARLDKAVVGALLQLWHPTRYFVTGYVLESKPEQAPNPASRVTLDYPRDLFGLNRVKLDWRTSAIDRCTVLRAEEIIDDELRRLRIGSLAPHDAGELDQWGPSLEGGWHQIGTTRAHADPKRGVVDADCKLHGLANLFVAGSSVFPTGGASAPTLTIVALAVRLSEHLQRLVALDDSIVEGSVHKAWRLEGADTRERGRAPASAPAAAISRQSPA